MNTISNRSHTSNQTFPETVMLFDDFIKARHLDTSRTHTQNDIIDTSKEESSKKNTKRQKKQLSPLSARVFDTETNRNVINLLTEYKSLSTRQFDFNQNSLTMSTTNPRKTNRNITTNQCMTSLSEGPYRDIVSSIYSKRSQIVPSEKRKERPLSENERTYFKNILFLKKKEQDIKTLKEKLLEKEKLNCSFIPKLTQSTKKIIKKRSKSTHSDFYNKCISWKNKKERNNQHQYMLFLKKSFEECRFYPKTNKNIHERVIEEMKNKRDDYIYQKNLKWLKDVRENRKKGNLERLEMLRAEQEQFKMKNQEVINRINMNCKNKKETNEERLRRNLTSTQNNPRVEKRRSKEVEKKKSNKEALLLNEIGAIKRMVKELDSTVNQNKKYIAEVTKEDTIDNNQTRSKREMYYLNKYSITTTSNNCNSSINRSEHCYTISEVNTSKYTCSSEEMNEKYRLLMIKYNKEKNKE